MNRQIDIIIPVYNGYDDLIRCLASIDRHTDMKACRVIAINDCSPDERILPLLREHESSRFIVIDNVKNLGFSANVNLGMQSSEENDVILLNSDTQVTAGWVEKLERCAYSRREIGTVTPLSNAATLCSYPVMCQDNPIPEGWTVDETAALVERVSDHIYPQITVAVGFCMYIKREVIRKTGLFDAATFGRGYGEENDFCNRAEQLGYTHVMCDDTFIYHRGTASFPTEEKKRLIEEHDRILQKRYPVQMRKNHLYCVNNPDQYIRDRIDVIRRLRNGKKTVLYLAHADFKEGASNNQGGTQFHIKDLAEGIRGTHNVVVAARDEAFLNVTVYTGNEVSELSFFIGEAPAFLRFRDEVIARVLRMVLEGFGVGLVHVHHVLGLSLDIFYEADRLGIPVTATVHDFYSICPSLKLIDENGAYCAHTAGCGRDCNACLAAQGICAPTVAYGDVWRREMEEALSLCRRIIFPSESARRIFAANYPSLEEKLTVIPHGLDFDTAQAQELPAGDPEITDRVVSCIDYFFDEGSGSDQFSGWAVLRDTDSRKWTVYVRITDEKGTDDLYLCRKTPRQDVAQQFPSDHDYLLSGFYASIPKEKYIGRTIRASVGIEYEGVCYENGSSAAKELPYAETGRALRVAFIGGMVPEKGSRTLLELLHRNIPDTRWYVFGTIGDPELNAVRDERLVKTGTYARDELTSLLKAYRIDLICILSNWPETFCYTLSEAFLAGLPVIGVDVGAVGERIRKTGAGWTVSLEHTAEEIEEILNRIRKDPAEADARRLLAERMEKRTIADMIADYRALYDGLAADRELPSAFDYHDLLAGVESSRAADAAKTRAGQAAGNRQAQLEAQAQVLREEIGRLNGEIARRDETVRAQAGELEQIKGSRAYRFACRLRKLIRG